MSFITKKFLLAIWFLSLGGFIFFEVTSISQICLIDGDYNSLCRNSLLTLSLLSTFFAVVLIPAVLMLPLKSEIFNAWKQFALPAIPVVLILTYYIVNLDHRGFVDTRPVVYGALLYGAYFLLSFGIIAVTWFRNRR